MWTFKFNECVWNHHLIFSIDVNIMPQLLAYNYKHRVLMNSMLSFMMSRDCVHQFQIYVQCDVTFIILHIFSFPGSHIFASAHPMVLKWRLVVAIDDTTTGSSCASISWVLSPCSRRTIFVYNTDMFIKFKSKHVSSLFVESEITYDANSYIIIYISLLSKKSVNIHFIFSDQYHWSIFDNMSSNNQSILHSHTRYIVEIVRKHYQERVVD